MLQEKYERKSRILTQLYSEVEKKVNNELLFVHDQFVDQQPDIENIIKNLNLQSWERQLVTKYKDILNAADETTLDCSALQCQCDNHKCLIAEFDQSSSATTKLKVVRKLLASRMIDTGHQWDELLKRLQQCLAHINGQLFLCTLELHYKIITTASTCFDGYTNLLGGLQIILNNRCFMTKQSSDVNYKAMGRVKQILQILLNTQDLLIKYVSPQQKLVEECIDSFVTALISSPNIMFDLLSSLDTKARWFVKFCNKLNTRRVVLRKIHNLVQHVIAQFLGILNNIELETKANSKHRSISKLSYCMHFLTELLKYEAGRAVFPIKLINSTSYSINNLLIECIKKACCVHDSKDLQNLLTQLINSQNLLTNDVLDTLLEPLKSNIGVKHNLQIFEENKHIFEILIAICNTDNNYTSILPMNMNHSKLKCDCTLALISELAVSQIRNFINRSENEHHVKEDIFNILHCGKMLYSVHPYLFVVHEPVVLITAVKDLYMVTGNYSVNPYYKLDFFDIFSFFIINYPLCLKSVLTESSLLHDSVCFTLLNQKFKNRAPQLITALSATENGFDVIKACHNLIILPCMESIWIAEEDEFNILMENDASVRVEMLKFLKIINIVSAGHYTFEALISFEDEGTIAEADYKPRTLLELLENCFQSSNDFYSQYVGLLVMKILIMNCNIALFIQSKFNLQEKLEEVQEDHLNISSKFNSTPVIIDAISSLRHNIIMSLKYMGVIDGYFIEKRLDQTQFVLETPSASSSLKKRDKTQFHLQQFLRNTKTGPHDQNWLIQARRAFKITSATPYKTTVIADLIEEMSKGRKASIPTPVDTSDNYELTDEDVMGINLITKCGVNLGLLTTSVTTQENLKHLMKQIKMLEDFNCCCTKKFNWFLGILYLSCCGNIERTKMSYLYVHEMQICFICRYLDDRSIKFYKYLNVILDETIHLNAALNMLGLSVEIIVRRWINQCFFNVLPFEEICNFLVMSILYRPEYITYFVAALFCHIKKRIFAAAEESSIENIVKIWQIPDFKVNDYLPLMDDFSKRFRSISNEM